MANRTLYTAGESIGAYTVDELVGPGRFCVTYRAHDAFGRTCALKVLLIDTEAERIVERAGVARVDALRHPNLAAVHGLVDTADVFAVICDYVEGPSLRRWLESYRPSVDEAIAITRGLVDGVAELHRAGAWHGALCPKSVALEPRERGVVVRLTDFGRLRGADLLSERTGRYLAPEVLRGAPPSARGDVWSIACVLVELFTGQGVTEWYDQAHLGTGRPEIAALRARELGVPGPVVSVLERALAYSVEERYPDASALSEALFASAAVRAILDARPLPAASLERGVVGLSEVGLAVVRSLGTGDRRSDLPSVRASASVEAVALRSYRPQAEVEPPPWTGSLLFAVAGLLALFGAVGIWWRVTG